MPKNSQISTILIIGSGPIIIGQACEFDYSGTQAVRTLRGLGYRVVLINSNPATIMTDPDLADATYIEPITAENILRIIELEGVDAILPTMGGQVALNAAMQLHESGKLGGVVFLGASPASIKKGEDRQIFKECMAKIGMDLPRSAYAYSYEEAAAAAEEIGYPLMIRASFTLGGAGSGVAYNADEFQELASSALALSPIHEILIEESLLGWKEYEMEVIRDKNDNCIIVCSIENLDPMGVHTGDSITVAPALTLTDKEFQRMRDASFAILREIGVDTGGANVQFAINPSSGRMIVIEMNPRVSRSSALASKATGYPIAKVATLLAVGFSLDEIKNDITATPASFEPVLDYVVVKIPRFAFEKFPGANVRLGTAMKSVGEVMALGRTFKEAVQKALCSLEKNYAGFDELAFADEAELIFRLRNPQEDRLLYLAQALREGMSVERIGEISGINPWFISQIEEVVDFERGVDMDILNDPAKLRRAKALGLSDKRLAVLINQRDNLELSQNDLYYARKRLGVVAEFSEVDTCAGEFEALTPYLYSSFSIFPTPQLSASAATTTLIADTSASATPCVLIIGSGPNRIGQGIEFDYACVHAALALRDLGVRTVMINSNPETVSTDYDTSDTLYFEPIDFERLRAVVEREGPAGIIVHFGGQTPLKFAKRLAALGARILGTNARIIDLAEDREKFSSFIASLNISQPKNTTAPSPALALARAGQLGYPLLIRPSYVLGGRAMRVVGSEDELREYLAGLEAGLLSPAAPLLLDAFLADATEVDVDALSDGSEVYVAGIMEHIEEAGVHSGDSACALGETNLSEELTQLIIQKTAQIALGLGIVGPLNIQFAIAGGELFIIEANPRASRTLPFVSKATGLPLAKIATRIMWNSYLAETATEKAPQEAASSILREALAFYDAYGVVDYSGEILRPKRLAHTSIKEAVFPFAKLPGSDLELGPEMRSTGEVMGLSASPAAAFAKAQLAAFNELPRAGAVFISLKNADKPRALALAEAYAGLGFELIATEGTARTLREGGYECESVYKISQGRPNIEDKLKNGEIALVINTSDERSVQSDTRRIRESIIRLKIPYFTNLRSALAAAAAVAAARAGECEEVKSLQEWLGGK